MKKFILQEVLSSDQKKAFIDLPKKLYSGNKIWVCPLDSDIENVFSPLKNEKFNNGEAIRWIALDEKGEVVGRIAAFYNRQQASIEEQPTGGCGFFESIDNQEVANLLFDTAKEWLRSKGMEAMDGPINFGNRDSWWGLLVDGFEHQPLYANTYNFPYYKKLFEQYGWQNYFNQYTYSRELKGGLFSTAIYEKVKRLGQKPNYSFRHIQKADIVQAAEDFRTIYNRAWTQFSGVNPLSKEQVGELFSMLKPIIDPKLIYFAYFDDKPIAFFVNIPDLNRIIGKFKGRFPLVNKLRLLLALKIHRVDRILGMIFGVLPEFQGKGVESGLIRCMEKEIENGSLRGYKTMELAWIGDFNPVMMRMVESYVCAKRHKQHTTYRYLFDRTKPFKRCPRIAMQKKSKE